MKDYPAVKELLEEIDQQANNATGPNKYVIRSLRPLIISNMQVMEASKQIVHATLKSSDNIARGVKEFEDTVKELQEKAEIVEKIMLYLVLFQIVLATFQFSLALTNSLVNSQDNPKVWALSVFSLFTFLSILLLVNIVSKFVGVKRLVSTTFSRMRKNRSAQRFVQSTLC